MMHDGLLVGGDFFQPTQAYFKKLYRPKGVPFLKRTPHFMRRSENVPLSPQATQTHVTREGCNVIYKTIGEAPVSRYRRPLKM